MTNARVEVRNNDVNTALKKLRKSLDREGIRSLLNRKEAFERLEKNVEGLNVERSNGVGRHRRGLESEEVLCLWQTVKHLKALTRQLKAQLNLHNP